MNTAALIMIVLASLASNTSGKEIKLSEGERNAIVKSIGNRTCSADSGTCVSTVIADAKRAFASYHKEHKGAGKGE